MDKKDGVEWMKEEVELKKGELENWEKWVKEVREKKLKRLEKLKVMVEILSEEG